MRKRKYTIAEKEASKIYSRIKSRVRVDYVLDDCWPRKEFIDWYINNNKEKECCYCGSTEGQLKRFFKATKSKRYKTRGMSLEIERKKSDEQYTEENCELACYWCNNAKSDVFSFEEFELIGKAIGDVIKNYSK